MNFFKTFFQHETLIVGLSGLKKQKEYIQINIPQFYKKAHIPDTRKNYLLF